MARLWTPDDLTIKPAGWWDAQDVATITLSAGKVSAWANKGTRGGSVTQATAASQPSYSATANGGKPALQFAGGQFLSMAYAFTGGALAFAAVAQLETSAASSGRLAALISTAADDYSSPSAIALLARSASTSQTRADSNNASSPILASSYLTPFAADSQRTSTKLSTSLNGSAFGDTSVASGNFNTTTLLVGTGRFGGSNGLFWGGFGSELIILEYAPTASEWAQLQGYRAWRWGMQALLPASHPYRNAAPMIAGGPTLVGVGAAFSIGGRSSNLLLGHTLPAAPGVIDLNGRSLQVRTARRIAGDAGAISLAGQQAALRQARMLFSAVVPISFTGRSAELLHGYVLPPSPGALVTAGGAAQLRRSSQIAAAPGSIQLIGWPASLDRIGRYAVEAGTGMIAVVPVAAGLRLRRRLTAAPGALTVTGAPILLVKPGRYGLIAAGATFTVGGSAAAVRAARRLVAADRRIAWEGAPAVLRAARRMIAAPAALVLTLRSATLTLGQARPPIIIPLGNRFVIPRQPRAFIVAPRQRAFIIRKGARMPPIRKYRAEERQYQADWSADLNGQTLVDEIVPTSSDPALIVNRVTFDGPIMKFWLEGGTPGTIATISFVAPTSGGEDLVWSQVVNCPLG